MSCFLTCLLLHVIIWVGSKLFLFLSLTIEGPASQSPHCRVIRVEYLDRIHFEEIMKFEPTK